MNHSDQDLQDSRRDRTRGWNCTCARNATEQHRTARGGLAAGHQHAATPAASHANIFTRRLFRQWLPIFGLSECMTNPRVSDIKHTRALQATFRGHDSFYRYDLHDSYEWVTWGQGFVFFSLFALSSPKKNPPFPPQFIFPACPLRGSGGAET